MDQVLHEIWAAPAMDPLLGLVLDEICVKPRSNSLKATSSNYPLVIKHGNGKSPVNGAFYGKSTCKWFIF